MHPCACSVLFPLCPPVPVQIGKSFDTFAPIGPAIVTPDEITQLTNDGAPALPISLTVNGKVRLPSLCAGRSVPPPLRFPLRCAPWHRCRKRRLFAFTRTSGIKSLCRCTRTRTHKR